MEFEILIKLLLFPTNACTDVHVRLESHRTHASSEVELHRKLREIMLGALKANFHQHHDDIIFATRT